jgi:two-component system LytT family response regulator
VPVKQLATLVAQGELVHLTTIKGERHTITYRLKDLEARLDPARFIRLGRGTLAAADLIARVHPLPGGVHVVTLATGQQLQVSRIQSRLLRERLLKL